MKPDPSATPPPSRRLAISIVSHAQGALVRNLLNDLRPLVASDVKIILTLNRPESEDFLEGLDYPMTIVRNVNPKGFGANHNHAFSLARSEYFAVLNPDVRCEPSVFDRLLSEFECEGRGVCAPVVCSPTGAIEDSARRYPTPFRVATRVIKRLFRRPNRSDYRLEDARVTFVDWVAGMFMLFKSDAFRSVLGFDEAYFMYLEDADVCRRLRRQGWQVVVVPDARVVHDAQRASRRSLQHFAWHASSMARFLKRYGQMEANRK